MIDPRLPLTDIHRHLDGNIRAQTILDLGRQFNLALPANDLESLRPHVQIVENEPSLVAFLKKLDWGVAVLADAVPEAARALGISRASPSVDPCARCAAEKASLT